MKKAFCAIGTTLAVGLMAQTALGAEVADKYQITAEEMSACGSDAIALCSYAYPDETKLLSCMKSNRLNLSPTCRPVFEAGIRRRHL